MRRGFGIFLTDALAASTHACILLYWTMSHVGSWQLGPMCFQAINQSSACNITVVSLIESFHDEVINARRCKICGTCIRATPQNNLQYSTLRCFCAMLACQIFDGRCMDMDVVPLVYLI